MSLYSLFKTNENLETEGIWIDYGTSGRIKIARAGGQNTAYNKALQKAAKPYEAALKHKRMDTKTAEKISRQVFVEHVILGWEDICDEEGNELEFSVASVNKLLDDLPELYNDLVAQASDMALFREEVLENNLGNSGKS